MANVCHETARVEAVTTFSISKIFSIGNKVIHTNGANHGFLSLSHFFEKVDKSVVGQLDMFDLLLIYKCFKKSFQFFLGGNKDPPYTIFF